MQGQRKSSGDLFSDGGEVGLGAKSGRDDLLNIALSLPHEHKKWEIQLDGLTYTAVCHSIMSFRISFVTERDTPTVSVHIPPAKKSVILSLASFRAKFIEISIPSSKTQMTAANACILFDDEGQRNLHIPPLRTSSDSHYLRFAEPKPQPTNPGSPFPPQF
jgi:hypothetical protein